MAKVVNQAHDFKWWLIRLLISALIVILVFWVKAKIKRAYTTPQSEVKQTTTDSNHSSFQNADNGQQNNNTGSGTQNVNNK